MPNTFTWAKAKSFITRSEGKVYTLQIVLSLVAILFVASNEFIPSDMVLPWVDITWMKLELYLRAFTWMVFVADFVVYGTLSEGFWVHARNRWLELIICLTWIPKESFILTHSNVLQLGWLTLIGSFAHGWRLIRWVVNRFSSHPFIVIASAASMLIASACALFMKVEPQTFTTLWGAFYFSVQSMFTVGYGDIVAHTQLGQAVSIAVIILGSLLTTMLSALWLTWIFPRVLGRDYANDKAVRELAEQVQKLSEQSAAQSIIIAEQSKLIQRLSQIHNSNDKE